MNTLGTSALVGAILTTAMVAGLLFSFAHLVMPGLATLGDRGYLTAFQRIDAAIPNPWMMLTFLGSPVLTLAALVLHVMNDSPAAPWLALGLALVAATLGVTAAVHLPLNATVQGAAPEFADAAELRGSFEGRWVRWNIVRTLLSVGALAALSWALFVSGQAAG